VTTISRGAFRYTAGRAAVATATGRSPVESRALPAELLTAVLLTASALLPLTFLPVVEEAFALPKLVFLAAASVIVLAYLAFKLPSAARRKFIPVAVAVPLVVYLALNVVSFGFSSDHGRSLFGERLQYQGLGVLVLYAGALCGGALAFRSWSMTRLLFWTITLAGSAVSVYALAQMADLDPFAWQYGTGPPDRAFSSIGQPNALAAYLVLVIPISMILLLEVNGRARWLLLGIVGVDVAALALTFSRAGYVAFALILIVALLPFVQKLSGRASTAAPAFTVVIVAVVSLGLVTGVGGRVADRAATIAEFDDISTQKHLGMWSVAGRITLDNPLVGTGQETYPEMFTRYRDDEVRGFGTAPARPESPHNNYLAISSSAGIPALGAYVALIGAVLLLLYRSRRLVSNRLVLPALGAALAGHMLTDSFMTAEITSSWMFWLLMGVAVAIGVQPHLESPGSGPSANPSI